MIRKAFRSLILVQGIAFCIYFGAWSIKDYIALEQAVAAQRPHEELRHRINVGFEGVWFLLSQFLVIYGAESLWRQRHHGIRRSSNDQDRD
jgi:hypothetical protein